MKIAFTSLFILFSLTAFSQSNNTNSPYARYGYGVLADQTFASQRGMGGIGYGLRDSKLINPLNPASFSAVDTMTFMLDFGVKGQVAFLDDGAFGSGRRYNGGLEYVALQFPLAKGLGLGLGIEPISFVGYQYGDTAHNSASVTSKVYNGNGGLNNVYGALSYNLFNRLSLGVNFGYLFGDIVHNQTASPSVTDSHVTSWSDSLRMNGLTYEFGLQYVQKLKKKSELVFGLIYSPKITVSGKVSTSNVRYTSSSQVTGEPQHYTTRDSVFQFPETYGAGISYRKSNKLTIGADFQYQKWAEAKFYDQTDYLTNRTKINLGGEYIPNLNRNQLLSKIHYRAGAYFANSYIIDANRSKYNEYGVSVGFGIPMVDRRSFVNMALEYSRITPQKVVSTNEQYFKLTLSYTFNELWFFKRKLQ
jgi:hypothetical protein